jgi:CoA-transferase family III
MGPPFVGGDGAMWFAANAGKRSVVVDLAHDRERILELVDGADVFVQSLRPGLAERHGIDAASLRARKPSLVHVSIGAYAGRPGYDPLVQAATGIMSSGPVSACCRRCGSTARGCATPGRRRRSAANCLRGRGTPPAGARATPRATRKRR